MLRFMFSQTAPHPTVSQSLNRVRAWLAANAERTKAEIAKEADVDEKTVRLAYGDVWNPTASTLQKFEAIIPADWQPDAQPDAPQQGEAA